MALAGCDFETVLLETLQADEGLRSVVDGRVYALKIPAGSYLPCVSFQRIAGIPANTLGGHSGLERIVLQVDAWGRAYGEAKDVARAVRMAMPARGDVFGAHLNKDADFYEDGTNYYRISMEYTCWFLEQE